MDRVIDIQFGRDEFAAHIIVELYAQGNIILTDENYTILSLLRSYTLDGGPVADENGEGPARCAVKEKYPFSAAANMTEDNIITDADQIKQIIDDQFKSKVPEETPADISKDEPKKEEPKKGGKPDNKQGNQKKQKGGGKPTEKTKKAMTLKQVIQKIVPYSSAVYAEHILRQLNVAGNQQALSEPEGDQPAHIDVLIEAAKKLRDLVKEMESADEIQGYIIYTPESEDDRKRKEEEDAKLRELIKQNQNGGDGQILEQEEASEEFVSEKAAAIIRKFKGKFLKEFVPHFLLKQYQDSEDQNMLYESFDNCVDEYFSQAEK